MQVQAFGNIHLITFLPRLFPVNCCLVEEDDSLTLVDAALPYSAKGILRAAENIGKPIRRIVLTHAHDDHTGALDRLKRALPHAQVFISRRDARLMDGDRSLDPGEADTPIKGGVSKKMRTRADVLLDESGRVGSLEAVYAPGHTPGLMAFRDVRTNALIAGDAFQTRSRVAVAGTVVPLFPFPAFGTWHPETALASARKLRALEPTLLVVGHGKALAQPCAAMDEAIREADRRLKGGAGHAATPRA